VQSARPGAAVAYNFKLFEQDLLKRGALPDPRERNRVSEVKPKQGKGKMIQKFLRDESGATAIEYGLIAAGIAVAIITVVQGLGTKLTSTFTAVQGALK
jgi:pilus assembly protein Flp/PilA